MNTADVQEGMEVLDSDGARIGVISEVRLDPLSGSTPGYGTPGPHNTGREATWYLHIPTDTQDLWVSYDAIQRVDGDTVRLIYTRSDVEQRFSEQPIGLHE